VDAPKRGARLLGLVLLTGATVLGAGCGQDGTPASPSSSEPGTTSAAPTAAPSTSGPAVSEDPAPVPFPADTAEDSSPASPDAQLTVTDVTTGRHEGYDRVVFELAGTGTPGWFAAYVDQAVDDPNDDVLDIAGDATLQVVLTGVRIPDEAAPGYSGTNPVVTPDYPVLREVNLRGVFEGQELTFVGVASAGHPFRVFGLTDPTRVVVDIRTDA
jgi:hypothetical protein